MKRQTPETMLKRQVKDYLAIMGWFNFPILQGLGSYPGISDMIAMRKGILLFIECKSRKGRTSNAQKKFECDVVKNGSEYIRYIVIKNIDELIEFIKNLDYEN